MQITMIIKYSSLNLQYRKLIITDILNLTSLDITCETNFWGYYILPNLKKFRPQNLFPLYAEKIVLKTNFVFRISLYRLENCVKAVIECNSIIFTELFFNTLISNSKAKE